jgi:hypothetical protein
MDNLTHMIDRLIQLLVELGRQVVQAIGAIELWLRAQLTQYGVAPMVQTILLVVLAAVLILISARLLSGLIRAVIIVVLVLLALHFVLPALQH